MKSFLKLPSLALAAGLAVTAPAHAEEMATGPDVGSPIPPIEARDQNGAVRTFDDLKGPAGLLLLFHRSADW